MHDALDNLNAAKAYTGYVIMFASHWRYFFRQLLVEFSHPATNGMFMNLQSRFNRSGALMFYQEGFIFFSQLHESGV
jgi:hypothetical protein